MIKPLNRNIIVKENEWEEQNKDGIILTTSTSEAPANGIIVEMAEDCKPTVKSGDTVYYSKFAGSKLSFNDQEFLVLSEDDLLGVLNA